MNARPGLRSDEREGWSSIRMRPCSADRGGTSAVAGGGGGGGGGGGSGGGDGDGGGGSDSSPAAGGGEEGRERDCEWGGCGSARTLGTSDASWRRCQSARCSARVVRALRSGCGRIECTSAFLSVSISTSPTLRTSTVAPPSATFANAATSPTTEPVGSFDNTTVTEPFCPRPPPPTSPPAFCGERPCHLSCLGGDKGLVAAVTWAAWLQGPVSGTRATSSTCPLTTKRSAPGCCSW